MQPHVQAYLEPERSAKDCFAFVPSASRCWMDRTEAARRTTWNAACPPARVTRCVTIDILLRYLTNLLTAFVEFLTVSPNAAEFWHPQDLMVVSAPFADAVSVPKAVAAKLAAVSTSSSIDSTDSHSDITADLQKHYNPEADVVLRWEFATERQIKVWTECGWKLHFAVTSAGPFPACTAFLQGVLIGVWVVEALGLLFLLLGLSLKLQKVWVSCHLGCRHS